VRGGARELVAGELVLLTLGDVEGTSEVIPIDYPNLVDDAREGNQILIDDGLLELRIIKKEDRELTAQVVVGGTIKSRKGVNLPDVDISMASLTEKDIKDLEFGLGVGVDYVAMSFVRTAKDVQDVISRIRAQGSHEIGRASCRER